MTTPLRQLIGGAVSASVFVLGVLLASHLIGAGDERLIPQGTYMLDVDGLFIECEAFDGFRILKCDPANAVDIRLAEVTP